MEDFLDEAIIMKDFDHENVLRLIGVAIENRKVFIVLPLMSNGSLKEFISKEDVVSFFLLFYF